METIAQESRNRWFFWSAIVAGVCLLIFISIVASHKGSKRPKAKKRSAVVFGLASFLAGAVAVVSYRSYSRNAKINLYNKPSAMNL
jgi:predicted membrane channel-forming protein YqfA (hemolysin III family)